MQEIISEFYKDVQIITPDDGAHYFFGYYDMNATGTCGKHLCHRVGFMDRLPEEGDVAEVGYLENRTFVKLGETTAWNFQQGAMLQYHPTLADTICYNVRRDGKFYTLLQNIKTGEEKLCDRATANISPDGKWGLAINFGRVFAFRPGYGYAGFVDEYADVNAPAEDGVFLVDLTSGTSKQIISYDKLYAAAGFTAEDKILVNHITFNPASDRFVMLVRNFPKVWWAWSTSLVIGDLDGNIHTVLPNTYFSHYNWINNVELVAHCSVTPEKMGMYRINTDTGEWIEYDMPYFHGEKNRDIHCNMSPDGNYIIGDGYPLDGYRYLMAYSLRSGESRELLRAKTVKPPLDDIRCDLHARFVFGGSHISFDTVQNGRREVALIPIDALNF